MLTKEGTAIAAIPYISPRIVGTPGVDSPTPKALPLIPGAAFREGDFVVLTAPGSTKVLGPTGSMSTTAGPTDGGNGPYQVSSSSFTKTVGNLTITGVSTSGAPAATYYIYTTYTASSNESLAGPEFVCFCPAGITPGIQVNTAGEPGAATNFAVYASTNQGSETLQQATKTTTATGSSFTIPNPLINQGGVNRAASGNNSNLGLAASDSGAIYTQGIGGSGTAGGPTNVLGQWMNPPPLGLTLPSYANVISLLNGQLIEISLKQSWGGQVGAAFGIALDTSQQAAGIFIADTTQTQCGNIVRLAGGALSDTGGNPGDTGVRVIASMLAADVI